MSLKEIIQADLKKAMQNRDSLKLSVLRMVMAAVFNKEKEKRAKLVKQGQVLDKVDEMSKLFDKEIIQVISSEAKKRKDSIEQYQKGNREDLVEQEEEELKILKNYLPEQMAEDKIRKIIKETIEKTGANSSQDIGKVMGVVMSQFKGRADGNVVNKIVQEELKK